MIDYYIAGPMRGYERWNFPAFREACAYVRSVGLTCISPHELDEAIGFTEDTTELPEGFMAGALRRDVEALLEVDRVLLLPGWEQSTGARFELDVARNIGLKVSTYHPDGPWWVSGRSWEWVDERLAEPTEVGAPTVIESTTTLFPNGGSVTESTTYLLPADDPWHEVDAEDRLGRLEAERHLPVTDDDTNPKDRIGVTKPQLHLVPRSFVIRVAQAMADGARKYGPFNWRTKRVRATVYVSAAERHLGAWFDGEDNAADSGVHHLAHAGACIGILVDAIETGNLVDDRPTPGAASRLIAELTEAPA